MLTIVIPLLLGALTFAGAFAAFDVVSALILAPIVTVVAFIVLMRWARKKIDPVMKDVEGHMKAQRIDKAISTLDGLRPMARWQPMLSSSVDAQIGILKYAHGRDFDGARPYLEKSPRGFWQPWAMLGAHHFRKKQYDEMVSVFERACKRNKKEAPLWAAYAWCEWKRGRQQEAINVLARARQFVPKDDRLKNHLEALQNGKKLKMHSYGAEWLALHLESGGAAPPPTGGRPGGYTPPMAAYGRGVRFRRAR